MKIKLSAFTQAIYSLIFLAICLWGSVTTPNMLGKKISSEKEKIYLSFIENETPVCSFQTFYGSDSACSFVFPKSTFNFDDQNALDLSSGDTLVVKCSKGSFFPVFIRHQGLASGKATEDFEGPFYFSMWLSNPQVPETLKTHVRYIRKKGVSARFGIKIGTKGDYRLVADENVQFLD